MFVLLVGLRRRLLQPYPFLTACSTIEPVAAEALALGWNLGLAALWVLEAGLRWLVPL